MNMKAYGFDVWDDDIIDFIQNQTANQVGHIRKTTRDELKYLILKGLDEGSSIERIALEIKQRYKRFKDERCLTIARTEVSSICNYARQTGVLKTKIKTLKKWINRGDERVRNSHSDMDNHPEIPADEYFTVGPSGSQMQYPGDPNGSPEEIINCRCFLTYRKVDKNNE